MEEFFWGGDRIYGREEAMNRRFAKQKYTPRFFYVQEAIMRRDTGERHKVRIAQLGLKVDALACGEEGRY